MIDTSPLQGLYETLKSFANGQCLQPELSQRTTSGDLAEALAERLKKLSRNAGSHSEEVKPPAIGDRSSASEQIYKIRNLDTGEEVDIRDENKDDFVTSLSKLLASARYTEALEVF
jgi:hypothetical protein